MTGTLSLTPAGQLVMIGQGESDGTAIKPYRADSIIKAFASCPSEGIIALAGGASASDWPLSWLFWRDFGGRYLATLCQQAPAVGKPEPLPLPAPSELALITLNIPPCRGPNTATRISWLASGPSRGNLRRSLPGSCQ